MQQPIIKNKIQTENSLELLLNFEKNAPYFDGHFDGFVVLAGVVQIHYVMLCAEKYFNIKPEISGINRLKFNHIIRPEKDVFLRMEYLKDSAKITFKYYTADKIFSTGNINLCSIPA
jgi:3-hydroxymyristoyl/3-hydroxydecanoyl-(acyl carrier protein) dehydratase